MRERATRPKESATMTTPTTTKTTYQHFILAIKRCHSSTFKHLKMAMRKIDSVLRVGAQKPPNIYIQFHVKFQNGCNFCTLSCMQFRLATFGKRESTRIQHKNIMKETDTHAQLHDRGMCIVQNTFWRFCNYVSFGNSAKWLYLIYTADAFFW